MTRPLNLSGQFPLMSSADSGFVPADNFAAAGQIGFQNIGIFITQLDPLGADRTAFRSPDYLASFSDDHLNYLIIFIIG